MPLLKGNLHTHTTFSDGRLPAEQVVARYRELGYDFLALTDHDDRIDDEYWFKLPTSDDRMLVLPGVERIGTGPWAIPSSLDPDAVRPTRRKGTSCSITPSRTFGRRRILE